MPDDVEGPFTACTEWVLPTAAEKIPLAPVMLATLAVPSKTAIASAPGALTLYRAVTPSLDSAVSVIGTAAPE
jgi:hypothetical protein